MIGLVYNLSGYMQRSALRLNVCIDNDFQEHYINQATLQQKVNHKLEIQQLSMKDQLLVSRLLSGHRPALKYLHHKIGMAPDPVCRKFGMGEEIMEPKWGVSSDPPPCDSAT